MKGQTEPQGFGDDIHRIAKAIKADVAAQKIAEALGRKDCGCKKRQQDLNNPDLMVNKIFYKNKEQDENIKK